MAQAFTDSLILQTPPGRKNARGFTMIELMITVAILGILLLVGLPSYRDQVVEARWNDAREALLNAASRQEQFLLDRNTYTATLANLGITSASKEGYYTITLSIATDDCGVTPCYLLTATPVSGTSQASDTRCTSFRINSQGQRTATGTNINECW